MATVRSALILSALLLVVPAASGLAHAQDLGFGAHPMPTGFARITPRWDNFLFTGNHTDALGGGGTADTGGTAYTGLFSVQADFRTFVVALAVPMAFTHTWVTTTFPVVGSNTRYDDQTELGNLELEGYANIDIGPEHRLLIGGGIALPTATDQLNMAGGSSMTTQLRGFFTRQAAWHTSFRNPAAWADQSFSIWPSVTYRYAIDWLLVTGSGSIPFFLPTHGDYGGAVLGNTATYAPGEAAVARGNVEVVFQLDVAAALRLGNLVDVGASFLGWALPSGAGMRGNPDLGQTAISLFVRTDDALDFPLGAGFEWILDLDNAWGPSGGDRRFWGAHAYLFGRIDVGDSGQLSTPDFHPDDVEPIHVGPTSGGGTAPSEGASETSGETTTTTTP